MLAHPAELASRLRCSGCTSEWGRCSSSGSRRWVYRWPKLAARQRLEIRVPEACAPTGVPAPYLYIRFRANHEGAGPPYEVPWGTRM